jgi:GNAT superfamily N-acetyltransferase
MKDVIFETWNANATGSAYDGEIYTDDLFNEIPGVTTGGFEFYENLDEDDYVKGEKIGELRFTALNRTEAADNPYLLIEMDGINADEGTAFCPLYYPYALLDVDMNEDDMCRDTYIVYIGRLFIEEKYRRMGMGTYILSILKDLLYRCFNIKSSIWLGIICPDGASYGHVCEHELYKPMEHLLAKCGFLPTNISRTYAFNASLHDPFDGTVSNTHFVDYIKDDSHNYENRRKTNKMMCEA